MTIADRIKAKFPIQIYLPYAAHRNRLTIHCTDAVFGKALKDRLEQMSVSEHYSDSNYANEAALSITKDDSGFTAEVETVAGRRTYRLCGKDPLWTGAWIAYALVTDASWLPDSDAELAIELYSSRQQTAASRLKAAVNYHYSAGVDPAVPLRKCVDEGARKLTAAAPLFHERPVTEEGWQFLSGFSPIFPREVSVLELSRKLYGASDFSDEIKCYVSMLRNSGAYKKEVTRRVDELFQDIYYMPLVCVLEGLESAANALKKEYAKEGVSVDTGKTLSRTCRIKRPGPQELQDIFSDVSAAYFEMAKKQISECFAEDLCAAASARLEIEKSSALKQIREVGRSLETFGILSASEQELQIPWNCFAAVEKIDIPEGDPEWTPESFVNGVVYNSRCSYVGFVRSAYLCSDKIIELAKESVLTGAFAIPGLGSGLVAAVYTRPLTAPSEE